MEEVLVELREDEGAYPNESQIKANVLKRPNKMANDIIAGKRQTVKFKSIQDLDGIVSTYKA